MDKENFFKFGKNIFYTSRTNILKKLLTKKNFLSVDAYFNIENKFFFLMPQTPNILTFMSAHIFKIIFTFIGIRYINSLMKYLDFSHGCDSLVNMIEFPIDGDPLSFQSKAGYLYSINTTYEKIDIYGTGISIPTLFIYTEYQSCDSDQRWNTYKTDVSYNDLFIGKYKIKFEDLDLSGIGKKYIPTPIDIATFEHSALGQEYKYAGDGYFLRNDNAYIGKNIFDCTTDDKLFVIYIFDYPNITIFGEIHEDTIGSLHDACFSLSGFEPGKITPQERFNNVQKNLHLNLVFQVTIVIFFCFNDYLLNQNHIYSICFPFFLGLFPFIYKTIFYFK